MIPPTLSGHVWWAQFDFHHIFSYYWSSCCHHPRGFTDLPPPRGRITHPIARAIDTRLTNHQSSRLRVRSPRWSSGYPRILLLLMAFVLEFDSHRGEILTFFEKIKKNETKVPRFRSSKRKKKKGWIKPLYIPGWKTPYGPGTQPELIATKQKWLIIFIFFSYDFGLRKSFQPENGIPRSDIAQHLTTADAGSTTVDDLDYRCDLPEVWKHQPYQPHTR